MKYNNSSLDAVMARVRAASKEQLDALDLFNADVKHVEADLAHCVCTDVSTQPIDWQGNPRPPRRNQSDKEFETKHYFKLTWNSLTRRISACEALGKDNFELGYLSDLPAIHRCFFRNQSMLTRLGESVLEQLDTSECEEGEAVAHNENSEMSALEQMRTKLTDVCAQRTLITYGELCSSITAVKLLPYAAPFQKLFNKLADEEAAADRPILSAVVVNALGKRPGKGFFRYMREVLQKQGSDDDIWNDARRSAYAAYSHH